MSDSTGTYKGPIKHLVGKIALLRFPPEESLVLAQFADVFLTKKIAFLTSIPPDVNIPDESLGFGWHVFRKDDFEIHSG